MTGTKSGNSGYMRIAKKSWAVFNVIVFVLACMVIAFLTYFAVKSRINGTVPDVAGYRTYIVMSGSMRPVFNTGALVVTKPAMPEDIKVGDIITYRLDNSGSATITHRVAAVDKGAGIQFITKGDANRTADPEPVAAGLVVGRMVLAVPYAGYALNYLRTPKGALLLVIIPGLIIIADELFRIFTDSADQRKKGPKKGNTV